MFGTTQYFVFTEPAKIAPNQPYYDFQAMQDEIGRESGLVSKENKTSMSQGTYVTIHFTLTFELLKQLY